MTGASGSRSLEHLVADVGAAFERIHRRPAQGVAVSPGRVNLIGEHTDYNDGFVLPMAIDRYVAVAFAERPDRHVGATSLLYGESHHLALGALTPTRLHRWHDYVAGVLWALSASGIELAGLDLVIDATLPVGAGLSSSAAIEMAVARAACHTARAEWKAKETALLATKAENEFVGMGCGVMDQLASACAVAGAALLVDCRSLETELVPLPAGLSVLVLDTGVRRALGSSDFNLRRRQCELALEAVRRRVPAVRALRNVDAAMLALVEHALGPEAVQRARHVIGEMDRPQALASALRAGDFSDAGALVDASHASLRDLYQVSSPELDRIVTLARAQAGCVGARMTGAGFGGCAIALVDEARADAIAQAVDGAYNEQRPGPSGTVFKVIAVGGAMLVPG